MASCDADGRLTGGAIAPRRTFRNEKTEMSLKSELMALQSAADQGILHAEAVVSWARMHPDSALHRSIQWDDAIAAREHRLWQARQLIQLHIRDERGEPLMVSLSIDRQGGGGYRPIADVAKTPELREIMLSDALSELERVQAKYARVKELETVWQQAETVRVRTGVRRRKGVTDARPAA